MIRDGIPFVIVPLVVALVCMALSVWLSWFVWVMILFLLVAAFMAYFFRNPRRSIPLEPGIIVAPADGKVTLVRLADEEQSESLVSIFLSPLDVHINRAPIEGEIVDISYKKGKFLMATSPDARVLNEQNSLIIKGDHFTVRCVQIAGVLARRIVCWKQRGERVKCGEQFGMIKFGSRTDVVLPAMIEVLVNEGMRVRAGETIIGRIRN